MVPGSTSIVTATFQRESSRLVVFVDGDVHETVEKVEFNFCGPQQELCLGRRVGSECDFPGVVCDLRVWSRALSPKEVAEQVADLKHATSKRSQTPKAPEKHPSSGDDYNSQEYRLQLVEDAGEMALLRELLTVTDPHNLGIGRDVKERMPYKDLKLVSAWKIDKPTKRIVYDAKKALCTSDIRRASKDITVPAVETKLDIIAHKLHLDAGVNEKLLLHGTKPELAMQIIQNGLNERFSGGLFGSGIYLAEDPSKIDQYCTADTGSSDDEHVKHLHSKIFTRGSSHPGGKIYYCFGVRVPLGIAVRTKDGETDMVSGNRLWATTDKRELAAVPGVIPALPYHSLIAEAKDQSDYKVKRHRELVTFNGDMTILEYLMAFTRVPK